MIINADCKDAIKQLIDDGVQVDAIVTDPPYELGFMGKSWDSTGIAYDPELWELCFHILKPGGHLISFGGARTYHRMACAIEDAGLEIRDQIMWVYGSGFPKSLNISKALDKMAGAEREVVGVDPIRAAKLINQTNDYETDSGWSAGNRSINITAPATDAAKQWDGFGTALKPAHEPIVLARKPLSEKTIAENVLKHGTGGLNIDACRVGETTIRKKGGHQNNGEWVGGKVAYEDGEGVTSELLNHGRFPANLIHDGSEEVEEEFAKYGESRSSGRARLNTAKAHNQTESMGKSSGDWITKGHDDTGTASRFFYSAKASKKERRDSKHPTVKPLALMRYLCRLITPPGGTVLDPFAGTGTTGEAAKLEGFKYILIEKEAQYIPDIERRLSD